MHRNLKLYTVLPSASTRFFFGNFLLFKGSSRIDKPTGVIPFKEQGNFFSKTLGANPVKIQVASCMRLVKL